MTPRRGPAASASSHAPMLLVLLGVLVVSLLIAPVSLSGPGLRIMLVSFAVEVALVTLGQALVMISGGIDLSVAGVVSLAGVTVGYLASSGYSTGTLLTAGLMVGLACGALNGVIVARVGAPAIMVTLATGILFSGISLGVTHGVAFNTFPALFLKLSSNSSAMPPQFLVLASVAAFLIVVTSATRFGTWTYAVGANVAAARLSGVPVAAMRVAVFATSGTLAALAGIIMTARLNSSIADMGSGLELASVTAAVLGGVSVFGGRGSLLGALMGVLTIALLQNAMTLAGVSSGTQSMIIALILLAVLMANRVPLRDVFTAARVAGERGSTRSTPGASQSD
jgi:ribose/xylose/arabinose/galactoside ABC-type transport system permease subunit